MMQPCAIRHDVKDSRYSPPRDYSPSAKIGKIILFSMPLMGLSSPFSADRNTAIGRFIEDEAQALAGNKTVSQEDNGTCSVK